RLVESSRRSSERDQTASAMAYAAFVHLRVHSAYSLSEGAIRIKELVELCRRHSMPAVAVTDTGNLFGALELAIAAGEAGVQPIIGCQLALADPETQTESLSSRLGAPSRRVADQLVLLVQSEAGYRNLMWLVSRSFLDMEAGGSPQVTLNMLENRTE